MKLDWYRGDRGCDGRKMRNKLALFGLVMFVFLILASISVASAATITVNDDGGADYTSIQDAINHASAGDSIEVWNGTYNENVDVNKSLTIYSRDGADVTIVEASNPDDHIFEVTVDYVNISINNNVTSNTANNWNVSEARIVTINVAPYGVDLSCNDTQKCIPPGGTAEYTITVKNTGNMLDTVNLTLSPWPIPPCGWPYGLNKDNVTLSPAESAEVLLYTSHRHRLSFFKALKTQCK